LLLLLQLLHQPVALLAATLPKGSIVAQARHP
jgi:hypothetical protein